MDNVNDTSPHPRGHFHPEGCFVRLDWSAAEREADYFTYLHAFGHEQVHYLQHIGSSSGHFSSDLEDLWIDRFFLTIRAGLERSQPTTSTSVRRVIAGAAKQIAEFKENCRELRALVFDENPLGRLQEFPRVYRQVLREWFPSAAAVQSFREVEDVEIDGPGCFGARLVMEAAALFVQMHYTGEPSSAELAKLDANTARLLRQSPADAAHARTLRALGGPYAEPFLYTKNFLPSDPRDANFTFMALCDLALNPPIGRYHALCAQPPNVTDLHPGLRLMKAARVVQQRKLRVQDLNRDYSAVIEAICIDPAVRWPQPSWLAMRFRAQRPQAKATKACAFAELQQQAADLRRATPEAFAHPRRPLIDELRVPAVVLKDDVKFGVPVDRWVSLVARLGRHACAQSLTAGDFPFEAYRRVPFFGESLDAFCNAVFGMPAIEVMQ